MDAGLAKVVNSTVGTSTVKALDTILKESDTTNVNALKTQMTTSGNAAADRLYDKLKASAKLVGSDDVMFTYTGEWTGASGSNSEFGSAFNDYKTKSFISFDTTGTVVIKTRQQGKRSDYPHTYYIRAYDASGNQVKTAEGSLPYNTTGDIMLSLNVTAGSKYKFVISGYNSGYPSQNLDVCGKIMIFGATATISS